MRFFKKGLLAVALTAVMTLPSVQAREIPAHDVPVPDTVSPALQKQIAEGLPVNWAQTPKTHAEWNRTVKVMADKSAKQIDALAKHLNVTVTESQIAGVHVYTLMPATIKPENKNRLLMHIHGGGYVFLPGKSGIGEGLLMAAKGGFKVVSVDYRMAPDYPYPAALDDADAVYRELLKQYPGDKIGVFGTSTGGGMTLALTLRAKAEKLPLPGAIAPGTPWSDLTKTGDSYYTNEYIDNMLVSYKGFLEEAAKLYANGQDMKDPMMSPVYGDLSGFPPTLLTSGTRDLFLSNTVRVHQKMREAGVDADLVVIEGISHAIYYVLPPDAPENSYYFGELSKFFNKHLKQ